MRSTVIASALLGASLIWLAAGPANAEREFPTQVFWGDTHLHTSLSVDAGLFGARLRHAVPRSYAGRRSLTKSSQLTYPPRCTRSGRRVLG